MTEEQQASANGSVFISYSRKDKEFVKKLNDALDAAGVQAWVDWEGIELASDWMATITSAIQGGDAFLYVISPDSLASKVCADELELGLKLNKKLIPILYRDPAKDSHMHEKVAATNWVYLRQQDNFDETIPKLIQSINTDLEWVRQHTQLLEQAVEWESKNRNNSFLLNGTELEDAERWMAAASGKENRQVLPLQAEFISLSRIIATRNQRRLTIIMSALVVAAIVFGIFALISRNQANKEKVRAEQSQATAVSSGATAVANEHIAATQKAIAEENEKEAKEKTNLANAQRSAAQSQINQSRAGELDTSTLLALDSWQRIESFQAEDLIRSNASLLPLPVAQMSQDGQIFNIEWSPDYEFFVTGNKSDETNKEARNYACVWRASDGKQEYCVEHKDDVTDALFSPDGKYLITASADKSVRFWDAANKGAPVDELTLEFGGAVLDLDASNSVLAIGREDNFLTLYYFNKPDLKPIDHEIIYVEDGVKQKAGVGTVEFSPNGSYLAFGTTRGDVEFWQANDNFYYHGPKHPKSNYVVLAFSPDNNWLLSGGGDSVSRITKRDGSPQHEVPHEDWVEGVAFGPDPSWYVTVSDDNKVRVVETATGHEKIRMSHSNFVQKVEVSPDGQWIATTGYDQVVRIWDSVSGSLMLEIPLKAHGSAISFNKDGTRIVAADESGFIGIWDISSLTARLNYIGFPEFVHEARFTPSGISLIVNADDYHVWKIPAEEVGKIQDGTKGEIILRAQSLTYNTAISPDSNWVAVVENDSVNPQFDRGTLVSLDGQTNIPLEHGGEVTSAGFSNDSKLVITAGKNGLISFWQTGTGRKQSDDLNNTEPIFSMAVSPVDRFAAAGLHDKTRIWDFGTGESVKDLPQIGDIVSATFSNDGKWLATGSKEGTVILWKVDGATFTQAGDVLRLSGEPKMLAFDPNNQWLAGAGSTGFAYLWDVEALQERTRIRHGDSVTSVSFSTDGKRLITVSRKVVQIWNISAFPFVSRDELVPFACQHLITNFTADGWKTYFGDEEYRPICPDK